VKSSIVDCQGQDGVVEEKGHQIDLKGKMWDICKRGYHFYQEKAFQEGSEQGTTCGSLPVGSVEAILWANITNDA